MSYKKNDSIYKKKIVFLNRLDMRKGTNND